MVAVQHCVGPNFFALPATIQTKSPGIAEAVTEEAPIPRAKGWLQNATRKAPLGRCMPESLYTLLLA